MKEVGSGTHALIRGLFEKEGLTPNVLLETSNQEFIKEMVERGEGIAFLVRSAVREDLARGRVSVKRTRTSFAYDVQAGGGLSLNFWILRVTGEAGGQQESDHAMTPSAIRAALRSSKSIVLSPMIWYVS